MKPFWLGAALTVAVAFSAPLLSRMTSAYLDAQRPPMAVSCASGAAAHELVTQRMLRFSHSPVVV